jgi:hypothetical protein
MGAAAKPRCAVVFLMILTLGVSLGLPAEDVLDAVYDESEATPLESTPLFSSDALRQSAQAPKAALKSDSQFLAALARHDETRAEQKEQWAHAISESLIILDHRIRC